MTRKFTFILATIGIITASAQAASAQAQESVPNPTKADAEKVVKIISADKQKIETYCKLANLSDEINKAGSAGDKSKLEQLSKQAEDLGKSLGPEFIQLSAGLEDMDLHSKAGEEVSAELDKLDKFCGPK